MLKAGQEVMVVGDDRLFVVRAPSKYKEGRPVAFSLMGVNGRGFLERPTDEILVPSSEQAHEARRKMAASIAASEVEKEIWRRRALKEKADRHRDFLIGRGVVPSDSNLDLCNEIISSKKRTTGCYQCRSTISNLDLLECRGCGWIICSCGACGCALGATRPVGLSKTTESTQEFADFDSAREAIKRLPGATLRRSLEGKWIVSVIGQA